MTEQLESQLRAALLRIAREVNDATAAGSEEQDDELAAEWDRLCPHPAGTDILFWPNEVGLCAVDELGTFEMSPEAMVDFAMSWEPQVVAMEVVERSGGESVGYYLYQLKAPQAPATQVATTLDTKVEKGKVVAVALKGVKLDDGTTVEPTFEHRVFSCGKMLGQTTEQVGTRLDK